MNRYSVMAAVAQQQVAVAAAANVTYVGGYSAGQGANTTGIPMVLPTHAADDFAIILARADQNTTTLSIGTATGWTQLRQDTKSPARPMTSAVFYKKLTSSSEVNPVVNISASEEHSGSVMVFRGVDTTTPFDVTTQYATSDDAINPANPPITTASANCALVLLCGINQYHIDTAGKPATPSGLVLGPVIVNPTIHCMQVTAYKLNVGAAGTYTPSVWTNAPASSVPDSQRYTIALRPAPVGGGSISIAGVGYTGKTLTATATAGALQWQANGVDIASATSATYVVASEHNGKSFTCVLNASITSNALHHWVPSDMTTAIWLDAADLTTITKDGSNKVSQWNDKSGNANNMVQTTAGDQYTYDATNTTLGVPAIVGSKWWEWQPLTSFRINAAFYVLAYQTGVETTFAETGALISGSQNSSDKYYIVGNSSEWGQYEPDELSRLSFKNGAASSQNTILPLAKSVLYFDTVDSTDTFALLSGNAKIDRGWNGPVAEIVLLSTDPSPTDRAKMEGYLAHKSGITLDGAHTYFSSPPDAI